MFDSRPSELEIKTEEDAEAKPKRIPSRFKFSVEDIQRSGNLRPTVYGAVSSSYKVDLYTVRSLRREMENAKKPRKNNLQLLSEEKNTSAEVNVTNPKNRPRKSVHFAILQPRSEKFVKDVDKDGILLSLIKKIRAAGISKKHSDYNAGIFELCEKMGKEHHKQYLELLNLLSTEIEQGRRSNANLADAKLSAPSSAELSKSAAGSQQSAFRPKVMCAGESTYANLLPALNVSQPRKGKIEAVVFSPSTQSTYHDYNPYAALYSPNTDSQTATLPIKSGTYTTRTFGAS